MTSHSEIAILAQRCLGERAAFRKHQDGTLPSPGCLKLFELIINGNSAAIQHIREIFEPTIRNWLASSGSFNNEDVEDIISDVFVALSTRSTRNFNLPKDGQLAPVIGYLNTITRNTALGYHRKQTAQKRTPLQALVPLDELKDHLNHDESEESIQRILLREQIDQLLQHFTPAERLLYDLKFEWGFTPKEIREQHPETWHEYDDLEKDIKRITLRLRKELGEFRPTRRKGGDSAFLQIEMDEEQDRQGVFMDKPCTLSEEILLDYVIGLATSELVALIEASPDCLRQAQQLAIDLHTMGASLFRLHCPGDETLVGYVERKLPGTARLLVYQHLAQCPHCLKEAEILSTIAQQSTEAGAHPLLQQLRRIVEAIYTPPLQLGLMGEWLHYRTPEVFINISTRQSRSQERSWNVRVQVRSHDGKLLTATVESALLERVDGVEEEARTAARVSASTSLTFNEIDAGNYSLSIVLPDEEIIIRDIAVGSNQ